MNTADIERVILFFYLAFLNEERALAASARVISYFKNKSRLETASRDEVLQACAKSFFKIYSKKDKIYSAEEFPNLHLNGVNLSSWYSFVMNSSPEEVLAVLFTNILNAQEEQIANIFNVSVGTVRHRLSRALRYFPLENNT